MWFVPISLVWFYTIVFNVTWHSFRVWTMLKKSFERVKSAKLNSHGHVTILQTLICITILLKSHLTLIHVTSLPFLNRLPCDTHCQMTSQNPFQDLLIIDSNSFLIYFIKTLVSQWVTWILWSVTSEGASCRHLTGHMIILFAVIGYSQRL